MKRLVFSLLLTGFAALCRAGLPVVSDATMTQDTASRLVTIHYMLSGEPGIVTLDIRTNGVSIGDANINFLSGDVNKLVTDLGTTRTVTWRPDKSWPGHKITDGSVSAAVCAWAADNPPDYMVADLIDGTNIHYYTSAEALPDGGLTNAAYRTTRLVLRKIPAKGVRWTMGSISELGRNNNNETAHNVTLSNDYYIGIYELTQAQWAKIYGNRPSSYSYEGDWAGRPVEKVGYNTIRGSDSYPAAPALASFLGLLRAKTGQAFDLPSEAQWELACRGTFSDDEGKWGDGSDYANTSEDANLNGLGRYQYNGGRVRSGTTYFNPLEDCGATNGTAIVGSYRPNSWGLYDMHGNVCEWCLDGYAENITSMNGAVNTALGVGRILRGGSWCDPASCCRSAYRSNICPPSDGYSNNGFRLLLILGQ